MKRVFVSYSRTNLAIVTQLIQDLQAMGIQTFYDQTLTGGQRWWDNILSNIRDCDIFMLALSPESWSSEACRSELAYVQQLSKTILPVLVADGINLNLLPAPINEIQVTDYRRCDKDAAFALVRSINMAPVAPPLPDPLPTPPRVPVSYLSTLKERIDSATPLSAQDQIGLIFEIEAGVREGRPAAELRDLLLSLRRRDDLLAKIAARIDEVLADLDARQPVARDVAPAGPPPLPRPHPTSAPSAPPAVAIATIPSGAGAPAFAAEPTNAKVTRSKSRRYVCRPDDAGRVITDVKRWLDSEGFDSQQLSTEANSVLLQIKKRGGWRDLVGMSTSLNIVFTQAADTLTVEIGAGKWIDKATVGTVSMFILWPLAVTAGIGAWEQMRMPDKIFDYIGSRFAYT
jgi:hypothetical protein